MFLVDANMSSIVENSHLSLAFFIFIEDRYGSQRVIDGPRVLIAVPSKNVFYILRF